MVSDEMRPVRWKSTELVKVLGSLYMYFEFPFGTSWDRFHLPISHSQRKTSRCLPLTSSSLTTRTWTWAIQGSALNTLMAAASFLSTQDILLIPHNLRVGKKQTRSELAPLIHGDGSEYKIASFPPSEGWLTQRQWRQTWLHPSKGKTLCRLRARQASALLSPWSFSPRTLLCSHCCPHTFFFSFLSFLFKHSLIAFHLVFLPFCLHLMLNLFFLLTHSSLCLFVHLLWSLFCLLPT